MAAAARGQSVFGTQLTVSRKLPHLPRKPMLISENKAFSLRAQ
jgi:hypothetical protein